MGIPTILVSSSSDIERDSTLQVLVTNKSSSSCSTGTLLHTSLADNKF